MRAGRITQCAAGRTFEVSVVRRRRDARAFVELPYTLHRSLQHWVAPFRAEERRRWSPRHNASLRLRRAQRFLARRDGRPVGRIAAIVDEQFASRWEPGVGFFGFFECEDDPEVARALVDAAGRWLGEEGMSGMIGPVNLTTHDEAGTLVEGFDRPPTLLAPYNPPWYEALLVGASCCPARDFLAYLWTPDCEPDRVVRRLLRSVTSGRGPCASVRFRCVDPRRWVAEVDVILNVYNAAFDGVWGFVPMTVDEFGERASAMRRIVRPELLLIAEEDQRPVGIAVTLPDVNEALAGLGGRLLPFGWLRILRRLPRIRTARCMLLGIRPECAGRGIGARLAYEATQTFRQAGLLRVELSVVQDENALMRHVIDAFGCQVIKRYRLYRRSTASADHGGREGPGAGETRDPAGGWS